MHRPAWDKSDLSKETKAETSVGKCSLAYTDKLMPLGKYGEYFPCWTRMKICKLGWGIRLYLVIRINYLSQDITIKLLCAHFLVLYIQNHKVKFISKKRASSMDLFIADHTPLVWLYVPGCLY